MSEKTTHTNPDPLYENLRTHFGFSTFKGNQEAVIRNVLAGNDTFVLMPTGGGKSLCYQLPALMMEGVAIIISPLIALMKNQVDAMRAFSMSEGVAHFLNSSLNKTAVQRVREDVMSGKTKLLYFAPESLTKEENVEFLQRVLVSFYAIDEAHCISEWGHDFRPEYRRIRPIIGEIGQAPLIALTATATPKVQLDIQKNLGMLDAQVFKSSFNRPNLYYQVRSKVNTSKEIIKYIKQHPGKSGIIYCLSRKKVEELAQLLTVNGIKALPYHAGIDSATRAENQDKFLMEEVDVIVATIAFGMGIDKPDVRYVIHYDIPKSLEGYYQETGRAGRDGGEGRCITFYSYKDIQKLEKFMQGKPVSEQEIGKLLLQETVSYAESGMCRRRMLLNYFGEEYPQEDCGCCDNCCTPKEEFEGMEYMVLMLRALEAIGGGFKADHLIALLLGKATNPIRSYKHHTLELFGVGEEQDAAFWHAVVRQGLILGLVNKDIENYGLLSISEQGREYLSRPYSIRLVKDHTYDEDEDDDSLAGPVHGRGSGSADPVLFAMLVELREEVSRRLGMAPYLLMGEPTIEDMTIQYPVTKSELLNITGMNAVKAEKYGAPFLELIAAYVQEHRIQRPDDMVVKSIVNKSGNKVFIIQSIDRKMDFSDIADAKGLTVDEVLGEVEAIVNSGTRLNIDYYIRQMVDEDKVQEIVDYFREEAVSDSVDEALRELGPDFTEEEVRLVRIKVLSEVGN